MHTYYVLMTTNHDCQELIVLLNDTFQHKSEFVVILYRIFTATFRWQELISLKANDLST